MYTVGIMDIDYKFLWEKFAHRLIDDLVQNPSMTLPGIRAMMSRYKVSLTTVEHALRHLETLGIIEPPQQGKSRKINLTKIQEIIVQRGKTGNRISTSRGIPRIILPI